MNDRMGEKRLVPARLIFLVIPRFLIISGHLPGQKERIKVLAAAKDEMSAIIAESTMVTVLT